SMDQSSSLLPLHKHKDIYPKIRHTETIEVEATTLDALVSKGRLPAGDYNVLALDIQGAELLALKGATETLRGIDAVHTEVNFDELYRGAASIFDIDSFLAEQGFIRVRTVTPSHPTWGDALYIRPPNVTVSRLGQRGRFGNQIFQYMFLRCYAKDAGYGVETPEWIGRYLFGADDPLLTEPSVYHEVKQTGLTLADCHIANATENFPSADFNGFFQYRTNYYEPHRDFIRSLFHPSPEVLQRLAAAREAFAALEGPVAGVHIRRGDYGYGPFFIAPNDWYLEWLDEMGGGKPVTVFLASDEVDGVRDAFAGHRVVTAADLGAEMPEAPYFPDFYFLTQSDALAISNSSFSFVAAMLNEKSERFMRPDLAQGKLIEFDPWNAEPLLTNATAEQHGSVFMNARHNAKFRTRVKRALGLIPK
ncbi:MAG: FkbM family methyltransferase, partial [Oricola sp.]